MDVYLNNLLAKFFSKMNKSEAWKATIGLLHRYFVRNGVTSLATDRTKFIFAVVSGNYQVFHPSCFTELQRHEPIICSNSFIIIIMPCWSVLKQLMQCFEQAVYLPISCFQSFLNCIVNYMQATATKVDQWKAKIISKTDLKFWIELGICIRSILRFMQQMCPWELICTLLKSVFQVCCSRMSNKLGVQIS